MEDWIKQVNKGEKKYLTPIGLGVTALVVLTVLGQLAISFASSSWFPGIWESTWGIYALSMAPIYLLAVPVMWGICSVRKPIPMRKHTMGFEQFCAAFLMCLPLMYGGNIIGLGMSALIGLLRGGEAPVNQLNEIISMSGLLPTFVFAVVLAPVLEELVFRKLLIDRLRRYGDKAALLISGLLFGLYHGNLYQFFYAAMLGWFFGFIYARTGRVWYTIALHMLINFMGSILPQLVMGLAGDALLLSAESPDGMMEMLMGTAPGEMLGALAQMLVMSGYSLFIMGGAVVGLVMLIAWRKRLVCLPGPVMVPKGQRARVFLLNGGAIPALAALLALMVWNTVGI